MLLAVGNMPFEDLAPTFLKVLEAEVQPSVVCLHRTVRQAVECLSEDRVERRQPFGKCPSFLPDQVAVWHGIHCGSVTLSCSQVTQKVCETFGVAFVGSTQSSRGLMKELHAHQSGGHMKMMGGFVGSPEL